jgi:hypothetical protein
MQKVTDGARALRGWLRDHGLSIPRFCESHRIDRIAVQRAVKGERQRISVDFAVAVWRATNGEIPIQLWESATGVERTEAA